MQDDRGFSTYGADAFMVDAARHMPRWLFDPIGKGFARLMLALVRSKQRPSSEREQARETPARLD